MIVSEIGRSVLVSKSEQFRFQRAVARTPHPSRRPVPISGFPQPRARGPSGEDQGGVDDPAERRLGAASAQEMPRRIMATGIYPRFENACTAFSSVAADTTRRIAPTQTIGIVVCFLSSPRTGGPHASHYRTTAPDSRARRGGGVAAHSAGAAAGDG